VPYRSFGIFRTFLAFLVLLQHIGHVGPAGMTLGNYATGSIAVLVFFTLSGFVITEAADRFYRGRPVAFLANRAIRILPQYLVALSGSAVAITMTCLFVPGLLPNRLVPYECSGILAPFNLIQNVLMVMPGYGKNSPPLIPYVWALRVEIMFYIVLSIGLCATMLGIKISVRTSIAISILVFVLSLVQLAPYNFQYTPYFLFGVVSYLSVSEQTVGSTLFQASMFVICLWTYIIHSMPDFIPSYQAISREGVLGIALYCTLNGAFLLLINRKISARWRKIDIAVGELSFPLYLHQYAALIFVAAVLPRSYMAVIAAVTLACVIAAFAVLAVEKPISRLRDRVRGGRVHIAAPHVDADQTGTVPLPIDDMSRSVSSRTTMAR
jgi:peptidoglycan/LPS O-acetylase OafA/YrhL